MKTFTWKLTNPKSDSSVGDVILTLERALAAWNAVCGVSWQRVPVLERANLEFTFGPLNEVEHDSGQSRRVRARYIPFSYERGKIVFNEAVIWKTWKPGFLGMLGRIFASGGVDAQDLLTFAIHEVGHALGLPHSDDDLSVMHPMPELSGLKSKVTGEDARKALIRYPKLPRYP